MDKESMYSGAEALMEKARAEFGNDLKKVYEHFDAYIEELKVSYPGFSREEYSRALSEGLQSTR